MQVCITGREVLVEAVSADEIILHANPAGCILHTLVDAYTLVVMRMDSEG